MQLNKRIPIGDIAVLFALPFAMLFLNFNWLFVKPIFIDRWIYSGFHMHLHALLQSYGYTYYASRAPWDITGSFIHHIFQPELALEVLHFLTFYITAFSLYTAVDVVFNNRVAALAASVTLSTQSEILTATGWDYVDGAYTACICLSLAGLTIAARRSNWKIGAVLWGAGTSIVVSLYILLAVLIPAEIAIFLLLNRLSAKRPWLTVALFGVAGFAATTLFFGFANWIAGGPFAYWLGQTMAMQGVASRRFIWFLAPNSWLWFASWLMIPVAVLIFSINAIARYAGITSRYLISGEGEAPIESRIVAASAGYLVAFFTFLLLELDHFNVLEFDDKVNALLPFAFLAIGGVLSIATNGVKSRTRATLSVMILAIVLLPWWLADSRTLLPTSSLFQGIKHELAWILVGAACMSVIAFDRFRPLSRVAALAIVCFLVCVGFGAADTDMMSFPPDPYYREATLAVFQAMDELAPFDPDARALFWFNSKDKFARIERDVVSSYLYGPSLINENFPSLIRRDGTPFKATPGQRIVFFTSGDNPIPVANRVVRAQGIVLVEVARRDIHRNGIDFQFVVTDAKGRPSI